MFVKKFLFIFFLLIGNVFGCYARQYPNAEADRERQRQHIEEQQRREKRDLQERKISLDNLHNTRLIIKTVPPKTQLTEKDKKLRDQMTAPKAEDLILLQDFLKQPGTGIFRLFPDYDCLENIVVIVSGKCADLFPGTWFYSFRRKDYSDNLLFDLQLKNGKLISDGFLSQGILTKLGNFSLDDVNLESARTKFLNAFEPAVKLTDIRAQYEKFGAGVELDGRFYAREVTAELGEVYLLRVIAYRIQRNFADKISYRGKFDPANVLALQQDKREDIIVAFRIIRKDANGSLTIITKEIARKKSPEIIFAEK